MLLLLLLLLQSTVQSRHYASLKHTTTNARTGHLLAGRSGRDDSPHPMWQCLAQAMGDGYWQRVRCLAAAAGCVEAPDPQFQKLVAERVLLLPSNRERPKPLEPCTMKYCERLGGW